MKSHVTQTYFLKCCTQYVLQYSCILRVDLKNRFNSNFAQKFIMKSASTFIHFFRIVFHQGQTSKTVFDNFNRMYISNQVILLDFYSNVQCCWHCNIYVLSELCKEPRNKTFFYIFGWNLSQFEFAQILHYMCILEEEELCLFFQSCTSSGTGQKIKYIFSCFWLKSYTFKQPILLKISSSLSMTLQFTFIRMVI